MIKIIYSGKKKFMFEIYFYNCGSLFNVVKMYFDVATHFFNMIKIVLYVLEEVFLCGAKKICSGEFFMCWRQFLCFGMYFLYDKKINILCSSLSLTKNVPTEWNFDAIWL